MKESEIQKAILDWLAAKGILAFRQNTGAMKGEHKGKPWFLRFGTPGMADILAFEPDSVVSNWSPNPTRCWTASTQIVVWIECKTLKGKQSESQKSFQKQVEAHGHRYVIARSIDDLEGLF